MRKREPFEILRGFGLLVVLWAATLMAVRLQLLFPRSVIQWLSESPNPPRALAAFCALVSSGVLGLLRLGIEVPSIKMWISSETARTYITGFPLWTLGAIFGISAGALLLVFPACRPPAFVNFYVQGRPELLRPNDVLVAPPGDFVAITAKPIEENTILSCNWQYIGEAFETIGASNGCQINLKLSGQPGNGFLTLQTSQDFCDQSSIFSLGIEIKEP